MIVNSIRTLAVVLAMALFCLIVPGISSSRFAEPTKHSQRNYQTVALRLPGDSRDDLRRVQREFNDSVLPILKKSCSDCHWGDSAEAGFNLESYQTIDQLLKARKKWQKVDIRVAAKEMPPEDSEPLTDDEHAEVMRWLDDLLNSADCTNINPGRVTIRRLNRTEYRNTIRDLIGIDYTPAGEFPGDDVGYGFDNIADVISLPPILMEKYLQAAEDITTQAIVDPDLPAFHEWIAGSKLEIGDGANIAGTKAVLFTNATVGSRLQLPESGKYQVRISAFGDQGGDAPVKISFEFNGRKIGKRSIRAEEDEPAEIDFTVRGKSGKNELKVSFLNDEYVPRKGENRGFDRNLHLMSVEISGPHGKVPASHRDLIPSDVPEQPAEMKRLARKILNRFASKAFRRRATQQELSGLLELFQQARSEGDVFEVALRLPMQAVLVSPHFLYKIETPVGRGETRMLNDFELATSLSYFLWSTMPDDELFRIAAEGKLKSAPVFRGQIKRMLADPKSEALVENFAAQWLQLRHLEDFQPDPELFPGIDRRMRMDMIQETKLMVQDLIRRDATVFDLLESEFSFINERLADLYGIDGVKGEEFRRVSTKKAGRVGLMTKASILTLTSNPTRTSPVKRGKWIMENLLGEEPPPPDPEAMELEAQPELTGTIRERTEQHRADPNCAVCHVVMDELGFALENYDAVGRWRETDNGQPIDAFGELPDGTRFEGAEQLQRTLNTKMRDQFVRCLTEKILIYATGRGLEYFDECAVDEITEKLKQNDYRFSELIYRVATSDPFIKRRGEALPLKTAETTPLSSVDQ